MQVIGPNVKRALCYCNVTPAFFGLGGGVLRGRDTPVETVKIYEQHLLVQIDQTLHQRTIEEVKKVSKFGGPVDLPHAAGSQFSVSLLEGLQAPPAPGSAVLRHEQAVLADQAIVRQSRAA